MAQWRDSAAKVLEALASRPGVDPLLVEEFRALFAAEPDDPPADEFLRASKRTDENRAVTARWVDFYSAIVVPSFGTGIGIESLDGITPDEAQAMRQASVGNTVELLAGAGTRTGRRHLSGATGITQARLLSWVNHADLLRVAGLSIRDATILEAAGVDGVPELARRNSASLTKLLAKSYKAKQLDPPSQAVVEAWIQDANGRLPAVTH
jgi:hypothetical protein